MIALGREQLAAPPCGLQAAMGRRVQYQDTGFLFVQARCRH